MLSGTRKATQKLSSIRRTAGAQRIPNRFIVVLIHYEARKIFSTRCTRLEEWLRNDYFSRRRVRFALGKLANKCAAIYRRATKQRREIAENKKLINSSTQRGGMLTARAKHSRSTPMGMYAIIESNLYQWEPSIQSRLLFLEVPLGSKFKELFLFSEIIIRMQKCSFARTPKLAFPRALDHSAAIKLNWKRGLRGTTIG